MEIPKSLVLIILDGWGINPDRKGNAVAHAITPVMDRLINVYPHSVLDASGLAVGLPEGQMGNSEVGHLNLGSGRVVYQDLTRINKSIQSGEFFNNPVLTRIMDVVRQRDSSLHLLGLVSDGGVHSHLEHLFALLTMSERAGIERVNVHAFLDGRDVPPRSALKYIKSTEDVLDDLSTGRIATVSGRYYAMDRDRRWERVRLAYDAIACATGEIAASAEEAVIAAYQRGENDEFVRPTVICNEQMPGIQDGDAVLFFNFRPDRARELTRALTFKDFAEFQRRFTPDVYFVCMTEYDRTFDLPVAFPPQNLENTLSEYLSRMGKSQLHIAETEKYAHVTFFFNGGVEEPFEREDRILIPSPGVATYDLKPEMSAYEVTDAIIEAVKSKDYDVIIANYANLDMVGHTGIFDAAVKAVEVVDACLGRVIEAVLNRGGALLVTADHGNSEQMMYYEDNGPHTAHTTNPVPFILVSDMDVTLQNGIFADIAPTLLDMLNLEIPPQMTGHSLIVRKDNQP